MGAPTHFGPPSLGWGCGWPQVPADESTIAIDGYQKGPLNIVDSPPGSYEDLNGRDCPRCQQVAAERDAAAPVSS